ncbi:hypothetical protein [Clostridium fallax]|uniref:Uncharacterized protein n=1 Tax=Clostridium fallax TaxID=1533 RepID=A0A1M4WUZ7_9CLOT|nr:hypothetical protein [Clostridium fallax]SHE85018.1 hypothetical protein SAMN05443638_11428 [Clostridium fallax]SQB07419.1 Uncharacterised protein [Clostridium fallax]
MSNLDGSLVKNKDENIKITLSKNLSDGEIYYFNKIDGDKIFLKK